MREGTWAVWNVLREALVRMRKDPGATLGVEPGGELWVGEGPNA